LQTQRRLGVAGIEADDGEDRGGAD
jgi:hypothetical protein